MSIPAFAPAQFAFDTWDSLGEVHPRFAPYGSGGAALPFGYPGARITAAKSGIFGNITGGLDDFVFGHSAHMAFRRP